MTIWVDAQLSPYISLWINDTFPELNARSVRSMGLLSASDIEIFNQAKDANVVVISKDYDFVKLIELHGAPPKLIWITCGNTSNARMCEILGSALPQAITVLTGPEDIVEIGDRYL